MSGQIDAVTISLDNFLHQVKYLQKDPEASGTGHYYGIDRCGDVDDSGFKIIGSAFFLSKQTFTDKNRSRDIRMDEEPTPDMLLMNAYLENEFFKKKICPTFTKDFDNVARPYNVHKLPQDVWKVGEILAARLESAQTLTGMSVNNQTKRNVNTAIDDVEFEDVKNMLFPARRYTTQSFFHG